MEYISLMTTYLQQLSNERENCRLLRKLSFASDPGPKRAGVGTHLALSNYNPLNSKRRVSCTRHVTNIGLSSYTNGKRIKNIRENSLFCEISGSSDEGVNRSGIEPLVNVLFLN